MKHGHYARDTNRGTVKRSKHAIGLFSLRTRRRMMVIQYLLVLIAALVADFLVALFLSLALFWIVIGTLLAYGFGIVGALLEQKNLSPAVKNPGKHRKLPLLVKLNSRYMWCPQHGRSLIELSYPNQPVIMEFCG